MKDVVVVLQLLSYVQLLVTPCTVAYQAPLFMECSRQEYWSGFSFSSPVGLLDPRIEPMSPALQVDSLLLSHLGSPCLKDSRHQTGEEKKSSVFSQGALLHCGAQCEIINLTQAQSNHLILRSPDLPYQVNQKYFLPVYSSPGISSHQMESSGSRLNSEL